MTIWALFVFINNNNVWRKTDDYCIKILSPRTYVVLMYYLTRKVMGDVDIAISSPWNRCSKAVFSVMKNIYYSTIYTIIYILNISVARLKTQSLIYLHFSWARKMLASFAQVMVIIVEIQATNLAQPKTCKFKPKPNNIQHKVVGL